MMGIQERKGVDAWLLLTRGSSWIFSKLEVIRFSAGEMDW